MMNSDDVRGTATRVAVRDVEGLRRARADRTAVERIRPTVVIVGFDDAYRSVRRETWPTYKANRTEKLETLLLGTRPASSRTSAVRRRVVIRLMRPQKRCRAACGWCETRVGSERQRLGPGPPSSAP